MRNRLLQLTQIALLPIHVRPLLLPLPLLLLLSRLTFIHHRFICFRVGFLPYPKKQPTEEKKKRFHFEFLSEWCMAATGRKRPQTLARSGVSLVCGTITERARRWDGICWAREEEEEEAHHSTKGRKEIVLFLHFWQKRNEKPTTGIIKTNRWRDCSLDWRNRTEEKQSKKKPPGFRFITSRHANWPSGN